MPTVPVTTEPVSAIVTVSLVPAENASEVHAVTQAAYRVYAMDLAPSAALFETSAEVYRGMASGNFAVLGATINEALAGCVRFRVTERGLYFFRLSVHPDYQGRGVAGKLLDALEATARERRAGKLWCQVRLRIARNVALYERRGFLLVDKHTVMRNGVEVPTGTMEKRV